MRLFWKGTLAALALSVLFIALGLMSVPQGLFAIASVQLIAFTCSRQRAWVCLTALTPEQVEEFQNIVKDLRGGWDTVKALPEKFVSLEDALSKIKTEMDNLRRAQISRKANAPHRPDQVSDECARHLGALAILAGFRQGKMDAIGANQRDMLGGMFKDIVGVELKTALSTSDIPLPVEYGAEVVELVSLFGVARKYGTVFPLGTGTVKLPTLGTDTDFTINAISAAVTEKSPSFSWVTFTAEKFGGLIRLPTEIEEDSIVAVGQFVARYAARKFAKCEDFQFFASTGAGTTTSGSVKGLQLSTIDNSKVVQMASTKTHYSDATLANLRALRAVPDEGAIGMGAYYMHTTFEQHLAGLNTAGDKPYIANGVNGPSLDGFPIRWVPVMPAYSTSANVSKVFVLFGDLSFQYLGIRGTPRFDTSKEAGFTTDEILIRALERLTIGLMAVGAVGGLETAAS